MSEKQFYNTKIGKDLQAYKSKNYKSKNIEQRPAADATEVERMYYLIPKDLHRITENGLFTSYYFLKIKNLLKSKFKCESCDLNRIIKDFGKYLLEKQKQN